MTSEHDLEKRRVELDERHRRLRRESADVADFAADVHEHAARVHEDLASPLLSPEDLRDHARRDRELAARERAVADEQD